VVNEPYIAYLSVYNQNVISFSNPVSIDVKVEEQVFIALFSKFIDDETNVKSHIKSHFQL
jgi:ribosomal protein S17